MRRIFTKIICFTAAAVLSFGVVLASACSNTFRAAKLDGDYSKGEVAKSDNGGFAVKKGDYIYFINGKESYSADNTYGNAVKGAIMRISASDFKARNYSSVQTVVPQIVYSGNTNAGIFIYGDYVYYSTPSTEKDSDGVVQSSDLTFKRSKLDGTETMKGYYAQTSDNSVEYRFVEEDGVVYLLYVATGETLYGETTGVKNLHSVNTTNNTDTLLAYDVGDVTFDKTDLTNPRVYYTMSVPNFASGRTSNFSGYNQIYTVTAKATEYKDHSEYIAGKIADYDKEEDGPLYVNCGTLVLDGIGMVGGRINKDVTPFNGAGAEGLTRPAYTYTISSYQSGNLFYTRSSSHLDNLLFNVKESELLKTEWSPVSGNPEFDDCIMDDGSSASSYYYTFDDNKNVKDVIMATSDGFVKTVIDSGKIVPDTKADNEKTFHMTAGELPTVLFMDGTYIYYSVTGGNGYTVNRISYTGNYSDYNNPFSNEITDYTPVRILDLDASSDWYKPEIIDNQILFPAQTDNMTNYVYILACDISNGSAVMSNKEISEKLNDKYDALRDKIEETDEETYENLKSALWYAHYTSDSEELDKISKAYKDVLDYDLERFWSKESVQEVKNFVACEGDKWGDYKTDTVKVNGNDVSANKRDYYYALLGVMNDTDAEEYKEQLISAYLEEYPEEEPTWFESLSTGAKAGFIIGVVAGGLIIIAAAVLIPLLIIRHRRKKLPEYTKKRVKVDTTDDKNIDVYSDEQ